MTTYNQSLGFGSGFIYMTPLGVAAPTPVRVGVLQDVSFDISWEEKELYGQNQWAVAIANGKAKGSIKAKNATIDSQAIGTIILNGAPVAGQEQIADVEGHSVPASSPYTVSSTNAAHWTKDLGVFYATTGQPLVRVASGPTVGQYSVASGVYTFAAADEGAAILLSYAWNDTTSGFKTSLNNQPMGASNYFSLDLFQNNPQVAGSQWGMRLYRCKSSKLSLATKQDDWMIPEFDASIQADAAGRVLDFNTPN